jgi:hypothetical protein
MGWRYKPGDVTQRVTCAMGVIDYGSGAYVCPLCQTTLPIRAGAPVRRGYTTLHDGLRHRLTYVDGTEVHRCLDLASSGGD